MLICFLVFDSELLGRARGPRESVTLDVALKEIGQLITGNVGPHREVIERRQAQGSARLYEWYNMI